MTADSSWNGAFAQLTAAGVHVRTYAASARAVHPRQDDSHPGQVFLGSENFSPTSMDENRELGLITSDATIRASLSRTFDADYAKATPYAPGGGTGSGGGSRDAGAVFGHRLLQQPLRRLGCVRPLQPARGDRDRHRQLRHGQLPHRRKRLRRHLLQRPASAAGETVTVHAGPATCHAKLSR